LQMYKIKNTRLISESRISIYTKYFIVPFYENISYELIQVSSIDKTCINSIGIRIN